MDIAIKTQKKGGEVSMLLIMNNKISLTRGDTARINISLDGYELQEGDKLLFTVKKTVNDAKECFQIITETNSIKINPTHTNDMSYGEYVYDVQLSMANGDIYTVVSPTKIKITEEVTW